MSNNKNKSPIKTIALAMFFVAIFLLYFNYINNQKGNMKVERTRSEVDKLCEYDMVGDYPKTPRDVVKLHCRFFKAFYIGDADDKVLENYEIDDEKLAILNHQIRSLYSSELLGINLEKDSLINLKNSIENMKKEGYSYKNYVLPEHSQVTYYKQNGVEMASMDVEVVLGTNEKRGYIYERYVLVKEGEQWKILGWGEYSKQ